MDFKTNYPYVFVHGMFGYGPGSIVYDYAPYFGLLGGSITKKLTEKGIEAYDAAVGPYSSAWDRACELYAQLMGTRVDYGKAHSERFGHERFGRTYESPLFEGWGQPMENGQIKKVNFVGHSFGGATTRLLISLLAEGCEAERMATDPSDISPLFTGGKLDWVYSESTYVAPHNGMTLFRSLGAYEKKFKKLIYTVGNILDGTFIPKFYDFKFDQWGLTSNPYSTIPQEKNPERVMELVNSKDNIFYDLSLEGAKELNTHIKCYPGVYYFSYTGSRTHPGITGNHKPNKNMFPIFKLTALLIGAYKEDAIYDIVLDKEWLENDGIINTVSGEAPEFELSTDFSMVDKLKTGIWYKMGKMDMDHLSFCGWGISKNDITEFYYKHAVGINNL
ncbi:MAG: hypothetical protein PUD72_07380 [Oscillospiraceae bacterium]|nr:hypothetical protein [Oscillospiraceae bacterium]